MNVDQLAGIVKVAVPSAAARAAGSGRASQKGLTFVPLSEARQVPVGSFLDTRRGTVRLDERHDRAGTARRQLRSTALFQVLQSRKRSARGLTELRLKGSQLPALRRGARSSRRQAAPQRVAQRRPIRRLRAQRQRPLPHPRPLQLRDRARHRRGPSPTAATAR